MTTEPKTVVEDTMQRYADALELSAELLGFVHCWQESPEKYDRRMLAEMFAEHPQLAGADFAKLDRALFDFSRTLLQSHYTCRVLSEEEFMSPALKAALDHRRRIVHDMRNIIGLFKSWKDDPDGWDYTMALGETSEWNPFAELQLDTISKGIAELREMIAMSRAWITYGRVVIKEAKPD